MQEMADEAPGWYGKLALLGDFASRRLAPNWVQACDAWLSQSLRASQQQLGPQWLAAYLSAPVWQFAWGPGVMGGRWWFGVLVPSCDAVGRYFPLLVATGRAQPPRSHAELHHLAQWWAHVGQVAVATLDDGASLPAFESQLAASPPWPAPADAAPGPAEALEALALQAWFAQHAPATLWWPAGAEDGARQDAASGAAPSSPWRVFAGLPPAAAFAGLLNGVA